MITENYSLKATDPQQYDSPELDWNNQGDKDHPSRIWFRSYIDQEIEDLKGKSVLDIGSGIGQLFPSLRQLGSSNILGIEPSAKNIERSRDLYPDVKLFEGTLQNFIPENPFDVAISICSFEHILDINEAFQCVSDALKAQGSLYLIIGDKEFNTTSHTNSKGFRVEVDVQDLASGIVATKTIYDSGPIYDIFRPLPMVIEGASKAGLNLQKKVDLANSKGRIAFYLLIFVKGNN